VCVPQTGGALVCSSNLSTIGGTAAPAATGGVAAQSSDDASPEADLDGPAPGALGDDGG
jgi:hypothetical protein